MSKLKPRLLALGVLALVATLGCSGDSTPPPEAGPATGSNVPATPRPSRTLPLPGEQLPQGHPPMGGAPAELVWRVPAGWAEEPPGSNMRRAQYRVPGDAGEGECIVYYFGPGQGGDPMSNAVRWAGQFTQPDGSPSTDVLKVTVLEESNVPVRLVEVTGTYDGGMTMTDAPAERKTDYMLLGSIVAGPDAPWFFKFTGPEATVRAQHDAFVGMMRSIRVGA